MKIYLRQHRGHLFYTGQFGTENWSANEWEAMEFVSCPAVETLCAELGFKDMEMLVKYGRNNETIIPVKPPPEKK